jgi:K+-transporting ATPase ATPase C chain
MNMIKTLLPRAAGIFLVFTLLCGVVYTGVVTGIAQIISPEKANGSMIEINGRTYGSRLLGQYDTKDDHMWGRIMNLDVTTYTDSDGKPLLYAVPSNDSPSSEAYAKSVSERVQKIRKANPKMGNTPIPEDLVTCSGSGLDPDISPAAANYQVPRIASASGRSEAEVRHIIEECTTERGWGIFGEKTVNVLKVNLMLDHIIS